MIKCFGLPGAIPSDCISEMHLAYECKKNSDFWGICIFASEKDLKIGYLYNTKCQMFFMSVYNLQVAETLLYRFS